jgi:hypothetical protein
VSRKKISTTVYLTQEQHAALLELHRITKVPMAEFVREGVQAIIDVKLKRLLEEEEKRRGLVVIPMGAAK